VHEFPAGFPAPGQVSSPALHGRPNTSPQFSVLTNVQVVATHILFVHVPVQAPQFKAPPQLSPFGTTGPQLNPRVAQVSGVQAHWLDALQNEFGNAVHAPQLRLLPHPLGGLPHVAPNDAHVSGAQAHWLEALQNEFGNAVQVPQLRVPPHPSDGVPHVAPNDAHVSGVQAHWNDALQKEFGNAVQEPQFRVPPQSLLGFPHDAPTLAQVSGVH